MKNKKENGITLISLVITMVIMVMIASISIYEGTKLVKKANVETLITDMLTLRAKAKTYAEEVDAQTWNEDDKETASIEKFASYDMYELGSSLNSTILNQLDNSINSSGYLAFSITADKLTEIGLGDLAEDASNYVIVYDKDNYKNIDMVYLPGMEYEGNTYYTLSALQEAVGVE